jgi:hypothetical protein
MARLRWFSFLGVLLFLLGGTSSPAQDRVREARTVEAFTEVALSVPATLHLRQGEPRSVEIEATKRVLDRIETAVENGRLKIRDASNFFERMFDDEEDGTVDVYVTAPTIEGISLAGSGRVEGETPIESASLALENAGSGAMDLAVTTTDLRVSVAGSGTFDLRGTAESVTVQIAGSGTIRGADLTTATAEISVAGSGDTYLRVTDRLSAKIMGSGDVVYRGTPSVDTSILGSGEVRSAEE